MGSGSVATYYDRLAYWNRVARRFGFGGGHDTLTVHRALADPRADGRATFTRVHDVVLEHVSLPARPRVLDAGCGLGGTMIAVADAYDARCTGLTLSASQAAAANVAARRRGLAHRVRAIVQSYDRPPEGPFDLVIAIESLAHASRPDHSLRALARVVAPGGWLVIVDDMPEPSAAATSELERFKAGWTCPVLFTEAEYVRALSAAGLAIHAAEDLTGACRPRSHARIAQLLALNRIVHRLVPSAAIRQVMDAHQGGLVLERMIRNGQMRYRMLVAGNPGLRVS